MKFGYRPGDIIAELRGHRPPPEKNKHTHGRLEGCTFSPAGDRVVTTSWDRTIRVWCAETGESLETLEGHSETVYCCAFSPDGARIATGAEDRTVRTWQLAAYDAGALPKLL